MTNAWLEGVSPTLAAGSASALLVPGRQRRENPAAERWRTILWRALAVCVVLALAYAARTVLHQDSGQPRSRVQRVALLNANRPPPPPKPVERPPEIPLAKQEVDLAPPPPSQQQADQQLGVDADGEGAGDGFGLVGKRGGQDITTLGKSGDGDGSGAGVPSRVSQFNYGVYAGMIRRRLQTELAARAELLERDYVSVVLLWIDGSGRIERMELQAGSGIPGIDIALRRAFAEMPQLIEPPPGLPQPLRMRVTSKDLNAAR